MSNHFQTPQKKSFESDELHFASQINTPPASVTKKLFNSFKTKRHSSYSFFAKTPKKSSDDLNDGTPKRKVPTPLNLHKPEKITEVHGPDSANMSIGLEIPGLHRNLGHTNRVSTYSNDNIQSMNSNLSLMSAAGPFSDTTNARGNNKNNSRKKYNDQMCYICGEPLKVFLKGEKPVEIEGEGLAHNECYLMKDELQSTSLLSSNKVSDTSSSIQLNTNTDSSNNQPQSYLNLSKNSNSFIRSMHLEGSEQNDLLTPVNQIVASNDISENGFQKENIKTTHQKVKNYSTIDQNLDFDVSILPQFYKVDISADNEDSLTIPHVLKLNNKRDYNSLKDTEHKKDLEKDEIQENSLIKDMSDEFLRLFPEVFKDYDLNTISIKIIDFMEISFSDEYYEKFIVILDSVMDKVFLMSLDGMNSRVLKFNQFYKVIRLEESILVYSKSMESPEISIRQPLSENESSEIMDMGFSLDKWYQLLKWRMAHKTIKTQISSFATNLFEVIEFNDCCLKLHSYIDYVVEALPPDIMTKIIEIANQEYLDVSFIMPTLVDSKDNGKSQNSMKLLDNDNDEPSYVCIVINTAVVISSLVRELVDKSNANTKLAFIRAQPDGSFSYIGFVDKTWDGLDEMDFSEKNEKKYLNLDNMFMKLYSLFTMNGIEDDEFIELKIFNDQPIEKIGKFFNKLMNRFTGISIYNYEIGNTSMDDNYSVKLENHMEQSYQFVNNYSTIKLSGEDINSKFVKDLVHSQTSFGRKFVNLEVVINPFFESCIKFKNVENLYGHKVFIENFDSIKSLDLKIRNELDCKLLMLDLEIINKKLFLQLLDTLDRKDLRGINNKVSLIYFKINNLDDYYSSNSVFFNIQSKPENRIIYNDTPEVSPVARKLILEEDSDSDINDVESDDSSTIDLFITTPITTNKEPLYLLREIELQLISIVDSIFTNKDKKMDKSERADVINYYYTIFFSYSKNIDIKNSSVNFGYESISKYIDIVFEILLSNDEFKVQMLYEMMRYQYRACIGSVQSHIS